MAKSNMQRLTIPSLVGGVTTQPEGQRFPNQVSEAVNVNLDLVRGLEKRDGSALSGILTNEDLTDSVVAVNWFERDDDEFYLILTMNDAARPVRIFNILDGCTEANLTLGTVDADYSAGLNGFVSVSDTMYLFNSSVDVAMDPTVQTAYGRGEGQTTKVDDWSDLTTPAEVGDYRWVQEDYPGHPAGFYVSVSTDTDVLPQWERVQTPEADSAYLASTMPIRLRCSEKNEFILDEPEWTPRLSGDGDTNPPATFVGQGITQMLFWSGRMWIVAGQQLVSSRTDDILNFWVDDEVNLNDADLIDLTIASDLTLTIAQVISYSSTLIVFTDSNRQFELTSGSSGVVSPSTVSVRESTAYPTATAMPARLGNLLYFPTNGGGSARLYEYIVTDGAIPSAANDVISHAFGYLPENITQMEAIAQTDQIFLKSGDDDNIYVYQQRFAGPDKVQNALFKWTMSGPNDRIVGFHAVGSILYVLFSRGGSNPSWRIEQIYTARAKDDINQDGFDYPIALDGKQLLQGVYDADTGLTTWTSTLAGEDYSLAFLGSEWAEVSVFSRQANSNATVNKSGTTVSLFPESATQFSAPGDWSQHPVIVGRDVPMSIDLSQVLVRDDQGQPVDGTLQLKRMHVHHRNTGFFEVTISPPGRDSRSVVYTAKQIGLFEFASNEALIQKESRFPVKVMSSAAGVGITISSDNPAPVNIPYIEIFGGFVPSKSSTTNYR